MTVTLNLKPEVEARLQAKAQAQGLPTEEFLENLVESLLPPIPLQEAVALYAAHSITQGQAAALAGISRAEFIDALGKANVSVFQYDSAQELIEEISRD